MEVHVVAKPTAGWETLLSPQAPAPSAITETVTASPGIRPITTCVNPVIPDEGLIKLPSLMLTIYPVAPVTASHSKVTDPGSEDTILTVGCFRGSFTKI